MKHLQILNLTLAALGATFALLMAVVCVLYLASLDLAPRLQRELPALFAATAVFAGFGAYAGLVWKGQRDRRAWAWWSQAALLPMSVALLFTLAKLTGLR